MKKEQAQTPLVGPLADRLGPVLSHWLDATPDMVLVFADVPDGSGNPAIVHVNPAFERHSGYPRASLIGCDPRVLQAPGQEAADRQALSEALNLGRPASVELCSLSSDGRPCWVEMTLTPVQDVDGRRLWLALQRDITARRQARLENPSAEAFAELQRRVAQLETFNRTISHQLQNPLNSMRGFLDLLQRQHAHALPPGGQRMLDLIERSAVQLERSMEGLLALNRVSRMSVCPVPVDLAELCQTLVAELRAGQPERRLRLVMPERIRLLADLQLLRLLFAQLIGNAWSFSAGSDPATITVTARPLIDGTTVTVRDNGIGFDPAQSQQLFLPFRRLHAGAGSEGQGLGLGLATAARVMERLGGWIWAEGRPGQGASFHVFFPVAQGQTRNEEEAGRGGR